MDYKNASGVPAAHDAQKKILELPGRFKIAVCGRRFGKTVAAAIAAVEKCEKKANQRVYWISPVQCQSDRVEREIAFWLRKKTVRKFPEFNAGDAPKLLWQHSKTEHALNFSNGSRIEFHSAHAEDHLRGEGLDLVVVDEAADVQDQTWETILRPMLLERRGEAFIIGTPRGKNHWLHRIFLLGQDGGAGRSRGTYASIRFPSSANPLVPAQDLEDCRAEMTAERFKQEYEAEFIDGANTIFAGAEQCIDGELLKCGRPGARYITGIDLGQENDFTVLCSIACDTDRMEGFARFNQMDWTLQESLMLDHLQRFPGPALVDKTGFGGRVFEELRDRHRGRVEAFTFTAQSRAEILAGLQRGISDRALRIANEPLLLQELYAFTYLQTAESRAGALGGRKKSGAPAGAHDDCVMALAMAWYGLKKRGLWGGAERPGPVVVDGVYA